MPSAAISGVDDDPATLYANRIGVHFRNLDLLRLALTHRSVLHDLVAAGVPVPDGRESNERLEFLGDAILGYVVANYLYREYPEAPEGVLTARRVALVRAEQLVHWARETDLGESLYLGQGERVTESARDRMLAGAFEAVIAAIAQDQGLRAAERFLLRLIKRDEARVLAAEAVANPKGRLQELVQDRHRMPPVYTTISAEGPAHARIFTAAVSVKGEQLGIGVGPSKRDAEQEAATAALTYFKEEAPPSHATEAAPTRGSIPRAEREREMTTD